MDNDTKLTRLSPKDQGRSIFYEMELKFKLSIEFKEINDIMVACFNEKASLKSTIELTIKQVVPFIPDDEILAEYAKMIQEHYLRNNKEILCSSCVFCGYNYLYIVKTEKGENHECNISFI